MNFDWWGCKLRFFYLQILWCFLPVVWTSSYSRFFLGHTLRSVRIGPPKEVQQINSKHFQMGSWSCNKKFYSFARTETDSWILIDGGVNCAFQTVQVSRTLIVCVKLIPQTAIWAQWRVRAPAQPGVSGFVRELNHKEPNKAARGGWEGSLAFVIQGGPALFEYA